MKYTLNQYALALYESLDGAPLTKRKEILERFYKMLLINKKTALTDRILQKVERIFRKDKKINKVIIESVDGVSHKVKSEIQNIFGKTAIIQEKINKNLIGGVRFFINDEVLVDASIKKQIDKLFFTK